MSDPLVIPPLALIHLAEQSGVPITFGEYSCRCGTTEMPYFDPACPTHGQFCGLKHVALARLHAGEKR